MKYKSLYPFFNFVLLVLSLFVVSKLYGQNQPLTISLSLVNSCQGNIVISVGGGSEPYSYRWYEEIPADSGNYVLLPLQNTRVLSNVTVGSFKVIVTDANNDMVEGFYIIHLPINLSASDLFSGLICENDSSSGVILLTFNNGVGPYSYSLRDAQNNTVSQGNSTAPHLSISIEGLSSGTYTLDWLDNFGCSGTEIFNVEIPPPLDLTLATVDPLCFGDDGSINFSVSGGWLDNYKVKLINNDTNLDIPIPGYSTITTSNGIWYDIGNGQNISIANLPAANYSIFYFDDVLNSFFINPHNFDATNTIGCLRNLTFDIDDPPELIINNLASSTTNVSCYEGSDGSISLQPSGGTPPYSFNWTTTNGTIPAGQATQQNLSGLSAGTYHVELTDSNGCQIQTDFTILEPDLLEISLINQTNISCNNGNDGLISVSVQGGTPPYIFTVNNTPATPTPSGSNQFDFSGLNAGNYVISVSDMNNCLTNHDLNQTLSEPNPLTHTINDFDLFCFGDTNGIIDGTISGGTPPYVVLNQQTSQSITVLNDGDPFSFSGLSAGRYDFTITDANNNSNVTGCSVITSARVAEPAQVQIVNPSVSNVSCFGANDGSVNIGFVRGTWPFSFQWTTTNGTIPAGQATQQNLSGLSAGTYSVVITDANGCQANLSETITEPQLLNIDSADLTIFNAGTGSAINISCLGANDGRINLTVSGGTAPLTYQWTTTNGVIPIGQENMEDLTSIPAGTYSVTVVDANNCSTSNSYTLVEPRALIANASVTQNILCYDGTLGEITVDILNNGSVDGIDYTFTISGANLPPNYPASITTNSLTQGYNLLPSGTYSISISDDNGCLYTTMPQTISQPSNPITVQVTQSSYNGFGVLCHGDSNGNISLTVSGGTPFFDLNNNPYYTYSWTSTSGAIIPPGQTNQAGINGISAGTYQVVVTDNNNCTVTHTYTVTESNQLSINAVISNYNGFEISSFGATDGFIDLSITGGINTAPYHFAWTTSNGTIPTGQENMEDLSGLSEGTYTVVISDDNGCTETRSFTLSTPNELIISEVVSSHVDVICFGDSTGVIEINIDQESLAPYDFMLHLSNGTLVESVLASNATHYVFDNLAAGAYTVTVSDLNGSFKIINSNIAELNSAIVINSTTSNFSGLHGNFEISCFGGADGVIDVNLSGGNPFFDANNNPFYDYELTNSLGMIVFSGQDRNFSASGLIADTYILSIQDSSNCTVQQTYTLNQPDVLALTTDLEQNITCFGDQNGAILISMSGGLGNYLFEWTKDGTFFSSNEDLTNLGPGHYMITVEDGQSGRCIHSETFTIIEPAELLINLDNKSDLVCFGDASGSIDISLSGGAPFTSSNSPYIFQWLDQNGTSYSTEDLNGVPAGIYTVSVSDANGCSESLQVELIEPQEILVNPVSTGVSCYGVADGTITINPTGGIAPYTIVWSDLGQGLNRSNLSAGTYTVEITDANNCTHIEDIEVLNAPLFDIQSTFSHISCFGAEDGNISLTINGGVAPHTVLWSDDPSAGLTRNNLAAGIYTVEVLSSDGCMQTEQFIINEPSEIFIDAIVTDAIDCINPNSGAIDLQVYGGTPPYSYLWNNGQTTDNLSDISGNNYSVTITDARGCEAIANFLVIRQRPITVDVDPEIIADCDTKDVFQRNTLSISGGFPPYSISWSSGTQRGANGEIMETDVNGISVATITDNNGCTHAVNINVNLLELGDADFSFDSYYLSNYGLLAINDPITFINQSSGDPISFEWDFGDGNTSTDESPMHSYTQEGSYLVRLQVEYAYGCSSETFLTIVITKGYFIEVPDAFSPNKDGVNDTFKPVYLGIESINMSVFDTWGNLLFYEESDPMVGWDGTIDGVAAENGNYIFKVEAIAKNGEQILINGPFTLIR